MKKLGTTILTFSVLLATLLLTGCRQEPKEENQVIEGVDFSSYQSPAITVKNNNTTDDMVLFKGDPKNGHILGGVRAGGTTGINKSESLFPKSEDFVVYAVTLENYKKNKNNPTSLSNNVYASFYAVYNENSTNEIVYKISSLLAGSNTLVLNNSTNYNVELRNMGKDGDTLCFSLSGTYNKTYHINDAAADNDGQVMLFPVFRKYDKRNGEIFDVYPTYQTGKYAGTPRFVLLQFDNETKEHELNASDWVTGIKFTPSAAYIKIINNADMALNFYTGRTSTPETTSSGGKAINTGKYQIFTIKMDQLSDKTFESSVIAAGYRLGNKVETNIFLFGKDASASQELKAGYLYTYTVKGGMEAENGYEVEPVMSAKDSEITVVTKEAYTDENGDFHKAETETKTVTEQVVKAEPVDWSDF